MTPADDGSLVALSDLRTAAYCPRKYYYRDREDDREPPPEVGDRRSLAVRYSDLLAADDADLAAEPVAVDPPAYRRTLEATRNRLEESGRWEAIRDPAARDVYVAGKDCHGIVHKVLEEPLVPSIVSVGEPPEQGVWHAQSVYAVAAAKALAWDRQQRIETACVEYPRYGVIRRITLSIRRKAEYRRTLSTVRGMEGVPERTTNRSKCEHCEYAGDCGVRTRTVRSLLGLG
ncbi:hypothetical protein [Saliphagus sp. LR7]|uniref:hypothetical protein n=1 Tax=Saliphagus sp. LR7 TaxID=2282654 RepID=UPI0018E5617E|nr:hypothetical protein [Saliphagus sp. LR7]